MSSVVLLSGGLDSAVALAMTRDVVHAVTFRYGQTHEAEVRAAARLASHYKVKTHVIVDVDLRPIVDAPLLGDAELECRTLGEIRNSPGLSPANIPGRNTILLSMAMARAEAVGANSVVAGFNADDAQGFPDCRLEFVAAFNALAKALGNGVGLVTPLLGMTKAQVWKRARRERVPIKDTLSCYTPVSGARHCGRCEACLIRQDAAELCGDSDPAPWAVRL